MCKIWYIYKRKAHFDMFLASLVWRSCDMPFLAISWHLGRWILSFFFFGAPILVNILGVYSYFGWETHCLSVSTTSVCWQCVTFWWDVLTRNQLEMTYLEMRAWWSHSDYLCNLLLDCWEKLVFNKIYFSIFDLESLLLLTQFMIYYL